MCTHICLHDVTRLLQIIKLYNEPETQYYIIHALIILTSEVNTFIINPLFLTAFLKKAFQFKYQLEFVGFIDASIVLLDLSFLLSI